MESPLNDNLSDRYHLPVFGWKVLPEKRVHYSNTNTYSFRSYSGYKNTNPVTNASSLGHRVHHTTVLSPIEASGKNAMYQKIK